MKKRIKNKLTSKKAKRTSLLVSAICTLLLAILCFTSWPSNLAATEILVLVFCCTILPILTYMIFYIVILKGDEIEIQEEHVELKKSTKEFLCKERFTEVLFTPQKSDGGSERKMLLSIIETIECRFFAKLKEDDEIILIVKDKEDNEIYSCEISNYSYFNARFKPKAN